MFIVLGAMLGGPPVLDASSHCVVGGTRGLAGTTVSIPVILRGDANVVALQAAILFDTSGLFSGPVTVMGTAAS